MGRERRLLLAVGLTVMLGGTLALAAGVLAALPALLAFLPLLAGRYLGADRLEAAIERLHRGASAPGRRHAAPADARGTRASFEAAG